jgi:hypothetical protein
MVAELWLQVEVVGCPTVCRHCWAQGVAYQAMPLGEVAWVLEEARRFCDDHGLGFSAYPMHELAAYPRRQRYCGCLPATSARPSSSRSRPPGCR